MHVKFSASTVQNEFIELLTWTGGPSSLHTHDYIELLYVLQGTAKHTLDGVTTTISKGDYLIVDYGSYHKYAPIGDTPFTVLNCLFSPRLFDRALSNRFHLQDITDSSSFDIQYYFLKDRPNKFIYHDTDGHVRKNLEFMLEEFKRKDMGYREIIRCQLTILLLEMMRSIKLPDVAPQENNLVSYITNYTKQHFSEKLTLESITKNVPYSLPSISLIFKKQTGLTFREFLQQVRIHESCRLLITTKEPISNIIEMTGYSDAKTFNAIFKRETGVTPSQFRKNFLEQNQT